LRAHRAVEHRLDEIARSIEPPRLRHGGDLDVDEAGGGQRRPHARGLAELEEVGSVRQPGVETAVLPHPAAQEPEAVAGPGARPNRLAAGRPPGASTRTISARATAGSERWIRP